jgi:hypothetical protein
MLVSGAINWEKWVAIGTLALAATTFAAVSIGVYGAVLTRRLARAAQRTADADTRALENSIRPLLLSVPTSYESPFDIVRFDAVGIDHGEQMYPSRIYVQQVGPGDRWAISVPVRNAGVGPAVISAPDPWIQVPNDTAVKLGKAGVRVIPAGERGRLNFRLDVTAAPDRFYVQVTYTDVDGRQVQRSELAIGRINDGQHEVVGFGLYRGADGELIVASGQGWDLGLRKKEWW